MNKPKIAHLTAEQMRPVWENPRIPTSEVAQRLGVTRVALYGYAKRAGLPSRRVVMSALSGKRSLIMSNLRAGLGVDDMVANGTCGRGDAEFVIAELRASGALRQVCGVSQ